VGRAQRNHKLQWTIILGMLCMTSCGTSQHCQAGFQAKARRTKKEAMILTLKAFCLV
jgi:hypothetical protein